MPSKKKYTNSDAVYKNLQDYFTKKNFEIGEKVPAERDIASALKVNRTTLRNALQRMVHDGILERQVGVGTFFKTNPKKLAESYTRVKTECCPVELVKIRMMLEPQVASIAAANSSNSDIKALRGICTLKKRSGAYDIEKADIQFHIKVVEIAKNHLLGDIYSVISCARSKDLQKCMKKKEEPTVFLGAEKWLEHQNALLDAFERKNGQAAGDAVYKKLEDIMKVYSKLMA